MAVIATNLAANTALVYLNRNADDQASSLAKISSGSRIVKASDDAAGLAVGVALRSDAAVLKQGVTNSTQAIAIASVADGALAQITDILERQKVLAAQSLSATVSDNERAFIDTEYQDLDTEITDIIAQTTFNGTALIDGAFTADVLVGTASGDVITLDLTGVAIAAPGGSVDTAANAAAAFDLVDAEIDNVSNDRAIVGAIQSRFGFRQQVLAVAVDNTQAAASSILDVDIAAEQTNLTNTRVLTEAAIAGLSQANQLTQSLLALLR